MHHSVRDPADCTMTPTNQKATLEEVCDACLFPFVASAPVSFRGRPYHMTPCFCNVVKSAVETLACLLASAKNRNP